MQSLPLNLDLIVKRGHFLMTSGLHSPVYNQTARLPSDPKTCAQVCEAMCAQLSGIDFDLVIAPALGAIVFGYEVARLSQKKFFYTERVEDRQVLRRDQILSVNERVVVVENVISTAGTAEDVLKLVQEAGAKPVAVLAVVVRRVAPFAWEQDIPLFALKREDMPAYMAEDCPLCKAGIALDAPGSRYIKPM